MEIYLIRHTKVRISNKICYGQTDVPLADSEKDDMQLVLDKLGNVCSAVVYSSPLKRCISLASQLSPNFIIDERLKEINMGDWEMKSYDQIGKKDVEYWLSDLENHAAPNGENYKELSKRTLSAYQDIIQMSQKTSYVITHDGIIKVLIAYVLKISISNIQFLKLKYASISKIIIEDGVHYLDKFNY